MTNETPTTLGNLIHERINQEGKGEHLPGRSVTYGLLLTFGWASLVMLGISLFGIVSAASDNRLSDVSVAVAGIAVIGVSISFGLAQLIEYGRKAFERKKDGD